MAYNLPNVKMHVLKEAQKYMDKGYPGYRVTSPFTGDREHPVTGETKPHYGVDLTGAYGWNALDYIIAPHDGVIVAKREGISLSATRKEDIPLIQAQGVTGGNFIKLDHGNGYETQYLHLAVNTITKLKVGDKVAKGTVLGYMGATGMATGGHLHFEVLIDKIAVNPEPYLLGEKTLEGVDGMGYIELKKNLTKGDTDREAVKLLQLRLCQISEDFEKDMKSHSFNKEGLPDGGFGQGTEDLMKLLQKNLKLPQTGRLDRETMDYLNKPIWELSQSSLEEIAILETQLKKEREERQVIVGALKTLENAIK